MKTFTKRLALVMGLLFTALICMGIVYIDNVKHYLSYLGGSVQLVVNTNQVMTVDTNNLFLSHKYPIEVRARTGSTTPPFSIVDTNSAGTNLFLVNTNGGHRSMAVVDSSFTTMPRSDLGGSVNGFFTTSTNCSPNASSGGSVSVIFNTATNCSPNASSGGLFNGRFASTTNCSPNVSSGGSFSGRFTAATDCSPNANTGGSVNANFSAAQNCSPDASSGGSFNGSFSSANNCSPDASTGGSFNGNFATATNCSPNANTGGSISGSFNTAQNCSPDASSGGSFSGRFATATNCSPNASSGGSINGSFSSVQNVSPNASVGGLIHGLFQTTTNSAFSAISSTMAVYAVNTISNAWTALRGGRIFGTATNSTNIVLHSSDGSLISVRAFDNTNLRATNGAVILGQPPAGTTNAVDGSALLYGRVGVYHSNELTTVSVTVSGSPFLFTNTFNYNIFAYVDGGTLTGIGKNGAAIFPTATVGNHTIPLRPGQWLSITNAVVPTLTYDPL